MRELTKKRPGVVVVVVVDILFFFFFFSGSSIGDKEGGVEYFSFLVVVRMIIMKFSDRQLLFVFSGMFSRRDIGIPRKTRWLEHEYGKVAHG